MMCYSKRELIKTNNNNGFERWGHADQKAKIDKPILNDIGLSSYVWFK